MDALVMCGGKGTRLDTEVEKPLFEVGSVPMVDRVCDALAASRVETVRAAVSPHAPATREHLRDRSCAVVETPGEGYVADLEAALEALEPPVLTCAADIPLLAPESVDETIAAADGASLTVAVPAALKEALGVSADTTFERGGRTLAPTGLNVVGEGEALLVSWDARLSVNVNRRSDAAVAARLSGGQ